MDEKRVSPLARLDHGHCAWTMGIVCGATVLALAQNMTPEFNCCAVPLLPSQLLLLCAFLYVILLLASAARHGDETS